MYTALAGTVVYCLIFDNQMGCVRSSGWNMTQRKNPECFSCPPPFPPFFPFLLFSSFPFYRAIHLVFHQYIFGIYARGDGFARYRACDRRLPLSSGRLRFLHVDPLSPMFSSSGGFMDWSTSAHLLNVMVHDSADDERAEICGCSADSGSSIVPRWSYSIGTLR